MGAADVEVRLREGGPARERLQVRDDRVVVARLVLERDAQVEVGGRRLVGGGPKRNRAAEADGRLARAAHVEQLDRAVVDQRGRRWRERHVEAAAVAVGVLARDV
eukprot:7385379-Prymnesium_polylepis.1